MSMWTRRQIVLLASGFVLAMAQNDECRVWLAPSSTSTETAPKLGLFAGVDYEQNATVGEPEIAIPLLDFVEDWNRQTDLQSSIVSFLEGYLWTPEYAGAKFDAEQSVVVAIPGHGILANYHSGTFNVDWSQPSVLLRERPAEPKPGVAHPSRGAITPYYNLTIVATEHIRAGMELFANFGDVWDGNNTDNVYQDKITRWDYNTADEVLNKIIDFMDKYEHQMSPQLKDDVLDFIMDKVLGTAAGAHAKVIRSLIPAHPGKLRTVKEMGGTFQYRNPDLIKSKKWLAKHGLCMDNLRSGPSTIPEAGRGAFASRKLRRGTVIAPAPMLQIPDKDLMDIYELVTVRNGYGHESIEANLENEPVGKQLMINYCFSHPESGLLLLPIGGMVNLINHQPPGKANAKIHWSSHKYVGNKHEWHDITPADLVADGNRHVSIVLEIVALRDIEQGEEVFIDYGEDWQKAWDEYMTEWNAQFESDPSWPVKAEDLKESHATQPYKTIEELATSPYPENITTACFTVTVDVDDGEKSKTDDGILISVWNGPVSFDAYRGSHLLLCDIVHRTGPLDDGFLYNYTINVLSGDETVQVLHVPQRAITFIDQPYTSDIHAKGAFRHPIGIPDGMFPQPWRDRRG